MSDVAPPMIVQIMEEMLKRSEAGFYIYAAPDQTIYRRIKPTNDNDHALTLDLLTILEHQVLDVQSDLRKGEGSIRERNLLRTIDKEFLKPVRVDLELQTFRELMDNWWAALEAMGYEEAGNNSFFAGSVRSSSLGELVGMDRPEYEIAVQADVSCPERRGQLIEIIVRDVHQALGLVEGDDSEQARAKT